MVFDLVPDQHWVHAEFQGQFTNLFFGYPRRTYSSVQGAGRRQEFGSKSPGGLLTPCGCLGKEGGRPDTIPGERQESGPGKGKTNCCLGGSLGQGQYPLCTRHLPQKALNVDLFGGAVGNG